MIFELLQNKICKKYLQSRVNYLIKRRNSLQTTVHGTPCTLQRLSIKKSKLQMMLVMNRSTTCRFTIDIVKNRDYSENESFININFCHHRVYIFAPTPFFYLSDHTSG